MPIEGWITFGSVLIILGIALMLIFRPQISSLINRVRSIDRRGVRIDSTQQGAIIDKAPQAEAEKLIKELDSTLLREVEDQATKEFKSRNLSDDAALRVAIRYASAFSIALEFERIYRLIWGSQLALLSYLNTNRQHHPREALSSFYSSAVSQFPDVYQNYSYDEWLGFLKQSLMLRDDNGQLAITVRGSEFLAHLTKVGYTLNKAG